jgi:hypothetical protein
MEVKLLPRALKLIAGQPRAEPRRKNEPIPDRYKIHLKPGEPK